MATEEAYHAHIWCGGYPKKSKNKFTLRNSSFSYDMCPSTSQRAPCLKTGVQNELLLTSFAEQE
jgi:hypothetical protein